MNDQQDRAGALALAGGAIVAALLDVLVEKDVVTVREVRTALRAAINALAPYAQTAVGYDASSVVATLMHDRFPQARGPSGA